MEKALILDREAVARVGAPAGGRGSGRVGWRGLGVVDELEASGGRMVSKPLSVTLTGATFPQFLWGKTWAVFLG